MLSQDDERAIEQVLEEYARSAPSGGVDTGALLSKLPKQPEALERLIAMAKARGLPPPLPFSGAQLSAVLASSSPYPQKVEALLAALRARHPELPAVIRKHLVGETDPFVVATLASALGQCGTPLDGALLAPLLNHPDNRVVANSLDALRRLRAPPRAEVLVRLLESPDQRVRTNAIAFLGVLDPDRALELVRALVHAQEPITRAGVAYVLGELRDQDGATELLLEMNEREQNMAVLKQIALSLKKHAGPDKAAALIGALHASATAAQGAKRSVIGTTLHEIAVDAGMVASEVERVAAEHRAKHGAPPPPPPVATPAQPVHAQVGFAPVATARVESPATASGSKGRGADPWRTVSAPSVPGLSPPPSKPDPGPEEGLTAIPAPAAARSPATTTASFAKMPPPAAPASLTTAAFNRAELQPPPKPTASDDGDEELSFSGVWGTQAPAAAPANLNTSGSLNVSGSIKLPKSKAGAGNTSSLKIPIPPPPEPRSFAWAWPVAGLMVVAGLAIAILPGTQSAPAPVASASKAPRKSRIQTSAPVATTVVNPGQNPVAAHLGPAGAEVSGNGRVVGITAGRPVIECQGQFYLVVKGGRPAEELKRGQMLAFNGKIMGSSQDGLYYIEEPTR